MDLQSNITNSGLYTIGLLSVSIAIVYAIYFYRKNKDEFSNLQRYLLSGIKFLSLFFISILILSPLFENFKNRIEKPLLIVGIDNSESMAADTTNTEYVINLLKIIHKKLQDKFQIETLLFGDLIEEKENPDFNEKKSDYSSFFDEANKRYYNLNVGAMVLVGDGIYNEGKNPEQQSNRIGTPIYTIGVGDTLAKTDQAIIDVTHNPNVFLGNTFPLEVEINFNEFIQKKTQLSIYLDNKLVQSENILVPQPNYYLSKTFQIEATDVGLKSVRVALSPFMNEQNTKNNQYRFTIEVHDNKKEILILSQGPHPDIRAISEALKSQANYNITSSNIALFNKDLSKYDLVILNQLPSLRSQQMSIYNEIKDEKIPLLIIVGPTTSIAALNNLDLHFTLKPSTTSEESSPFFNSSFPMFSLPQNINEVGNIYPPLLTYFTEYELSDEYSILAFQKINGIEMNYPLIIAGDIDQRKVGVIMGEGIWRWRIHEFQNYDNQNAFNQTIIKLINYLSLKDEREQFKVFHDRLISETSQVKIKAQVFDELYEPVQNAEVKLTLTDSLENEMAYLFDANTTDYSLNLGFLPAGNYHFSAQTTLGDKVLIKDGIFSVQEVNIEQQNLQANFKTLLTLSRNSNGRFFLKEESAELIDMLKTDQTLENKIHTEKSIHELIDWKWFILLILFLLSMEWFLRKFWGSY